MQIIEALALYKQQLAADGRSEHTRKQAERHVMLFAAWTRDRAVEAVRHEDLAQFLASEVVTKTATGAPRKASSANALRSSLRCFFSFVHAAGYTSVNAARLVRRARCGQSRPRALPERDCERLITALEQARTPAERRDRALFHLLLRCGLRVGSAVALDVEDADLDSCTLRLRHMKNSDEDVVFVPPQTAELLRGYLGTRMNGPLFTSQDGGRLGTRSVHRRLGHWTKRAGISRAVGPHALRHALAMRVYRATGDLLVTARVLCHRSLASTAVYARPSETAIRSAIGSYTRPNAEEHSLVL
jgi:site-specific recombinase XerD